MNVVFLGTSAFAVPVLDALRESGHRVALVVTRPDAARGRGRSVGPSPIGARAAELGLECFCPPRVNEADAVDRIRFAAPDLLVVVAYGQILKDDLLNMGPCGAVNLHGSLLPDLRGAAPIARAIQRGMTRTGVSLQFVAREMDAGDVIDTDALSIASDDTTGSLTARMAPVAAALLMRNLEALASGTANRTSQDSSAVTFAPRLEKREGRIPWSKSAQEVRNHIRAMTPWPGAFSDLEGAGRSAVRVVVREVVEVPASQGSKPGDVVGSVGGLDVAVGSGALRIRRLLRAGRKEMDAEEFLRGLRLEPGARLQ